ncbi:MAG: coenzyme F420-0:L-glutamate ligase [Elusimicrobiales bacterium]|nr:coenzyme F420-0:L-glutamate ligase [Elusimicrobiales bacterium]
MKLTAVKTAVFKEREDLPAFILRHIPQASERSILAVASKLFALWKGEILPYESVSQKETLIRRESSSALKTPLAWLTIKDGMIMTNAGIDESNADGKLLLLPRNCYAAAEELRQELCARWGVKDLGVLVTDSMILPLRAGVTAAAVAYAGFKGVKDLRGTPDIFGKKLEVTLVNAADSLASAAALCMGEGKEQSPLCVIENAPVEFRPGADPKEIKYPVENDLYTPLFQAAGLIKKGDCND